MSIRHRLHITLALVSALLLPLAPPAGAAPAQAPAQAGLTVLSRNLYLGADLLPVIAAPPEQFLAATTWTWQKVLASNFPERAEALAHEVRATRPDVIGLQEVALWRSGMPGTIAQTVRLDFLQILQQALAKRGLHYTVVSEVANFDAQVPTLLGFDIRFTDRDAILVRDGLATANPSQGNFADRMFVPQPGATGSWMPILRGWNAVDVVAGGQTTRFVNAHLEAYDLDVARGQLGELLAGPAAPGKPTVLLGDLNATPQTLLYADAVNAGFADAWSGPRPGYTCCEAEDVANRVSELDRRIDYILVRGLRAAATRVIGDKPGDRTPSGLWPSDHAGVVTRVRPH
ncbi:MAG TPA: endonuclease/exonuclease/phosphatase family protein [Egibacteraceae bacterium]|nr:endonuclease/exonuclease/phosphatase family protein [Egibacteraceae bacterium]